MTANFRFSKTRPNWPGFFFYIFDKLLTTQNVNVVRFARTVEWDFLDKYWNLNTVCYGSSAKQAKWERIWPTTMAFYCLKFYATGQRCWSLRKTWRFQSQRRRAISEGKIPYMSQGWKIMRKQEKRSVWKSRKKKSFIIEFSRKKSP